jgi:hypothetical protein
VNLFALFVDCTQLLDVSILEYLLDLLVNFIIEGLWLILQLLEFRISFLDVSGLEFIVLKECLYSLVMGI